MIDLERRERLKKICLVLLAIPLLKFLPFELFKNENKDTNIYARDGTLMVSIQ